MRIRIASILALIGLCAGGVQAQEISVPYARTGVIGVPNYYVVQPGDSLELITEAYYGTPYDWPLIWSYNPHITNPHWIYPGDVIFLRPAADPADAPPQRPPGAPGTHYPLGGFYTGAELDDVGFIRFSPAPYMLLSLWDTVFVQFDDPGAVEVGQRYALNRVMDRVYDDDDELIAVKYRVTGVVEVRSKPANSPLVEGRIIQAWDTIERGDVLFVNQRHIRVVEPRPANVNIEGTILDFFAPSTFAAQTFYVFIDAGFNDGVREGNRFIIWDRYDEYAELSDGEPGWDEDDHIEDLPWLAMGEAIVVYTSDAYSTAVITNSRLELTRGMRLTMSEGY